MSTLDFQKALVQLVKLPDHFRENDFQNFLSTFDLTQREKDQLNFLIKEKFLASFAKKERNNRFALNAGIIYKNLFKFLDRNIVKKIYTEEFEPVTVGNTKDIKVSTIAKEFKNFLIEHSFLETNSLDKNFLEDVIEYDFCEFQIYGGRIDQSWHIKANSLLNPKTPFIIKDFRYDLLPYIELFDNSQNKNIPAPKEKETTLLFMRSKNDEGEAMEQFEIDDNLKQFLASQLKGEYSKDLPDCYQDLIDLELCVPL